MMGNHIIKAARCALLLPCSTAKQQPVMGSKKERKEERKKGRKKEPSLRKTESKTDRKQPGGTGLTGPTPDCHRKTTAPPK